MVLRGLRERFFERAASRDRRGRGAGAIRSLFACMACVPVAILGAACVRSTPPVAPTVVVVDGVGASAVLTSSNEPTASAGSWQPRDEVEVEWQGSWWPAVVLEKRGTRWLVHYEGYSDDWDEVVSGERIRERRVEPSMDEPSEDEDEPDP